VFHWYIYTSIYVLKTSGWQTLKQNQYEIVLVLAGSVIITLNLPTRMRPVAYQNTLNAGTLYADLNAKDTHTHTHTDYRGPLWSLHSVFGMNNLVIVTCKKTRLRRKFMSKLFARLLAKSANFVTCITESLPCLKQTAWNLLKFQTHLVVRINELNNFNNTETSRKSAQNVRE